MLLTENFQTTKACLSANIATTAMCLSSPMTARRLLPARRANFMSAQPLWQTGIIKIPKKQPRHSFKIRSTIATPKECIKQAILSNTTISASLFTYRARISKSSVWATASSLAKLKPHCTAWTASLPQPACSTVIATALSASTRASRTLPRSRVPCAGWCPSTCCPTSTKSWTHCR